MKKHLIFAIPLVMRTAAFVGNMDTPYSATSRYLTHGGQPILPISGEIHFSRCERREWRRELLKMKECGLTAVAVYVFWNHHEQKKDAFAGMGTGISPRSCSCAVRWGFKLFCGSVHGVTGRRALADSRTG